MAKVFLIVFFYLKITELYLDESDDRSLLANKYIAANKIEIKAYIIKSIPCKKLKDIEMSSSEDMLEMVGGMIPVSPLSLRRKILRC